MIFWVKSVSYRIFSLSSKVLLEKNILKKKKKTIPDEITFLKNFKIDKNLNFLRYENNL